MLTLGNYRIFDLFWEMFSRGSFVIVGIEPSLEFNVRIVGQASLFGGFAIIRINLEQTK